MKKNHLLALPLFAVLVACGGDEKKPPQTPTGTDNTAHVTPTTTSAQPDPNKLAVNVDPDILKACSLKFDTVENAPKFDYDNDQLTPDEKNILEQVAKCLTTGPLKGRQVQLVGRADPRGTTEYNMTLGARRAHNTKEFLANLGVAGTQMSETSRGELDATGTDEPGWQKDRRVDVKLVK
ncbi:MAG TPA: OmpA family protein [Labilithrix sp.]|jgi:peptidoglycan-associated lipoprotein